MNAENELKRFIQHNPKSREAQAYRLGRKQANLELKSSINRLQPDTNRVD